MTDRFAFARPPHSDGAEALRAEIRTFIEQERGGWTAFERAQSWNRFDPEFSRKMGARGWIGVTWPEQYGGRALGSAERYVILEEMLGAAAPVSAHWVADRQSGPLLLKFGSEDQKRSILPRIAAGECYFAIGMSEPNAGSDLAATRTRATPVDGGWRINGSKIWTSNAHRMHYMILFCRTGQNQEQRRGGMSQFLVDMATPGITVRPIIDMAGQHHFNEVFFEDAFVPAEALVGAEGQGWEQVMSELGYERSGPERFLSTITILVELIRLLQADRSDARARAVIGRLVAHYVVLRRLSRSVAHMLDLGEAVDVHASIVKDLGSVLEQEVPEVARQLWPVLPSLNSTDPYPAAMANTILNVPSYSLRGGTREILRGLIARGLGMR